MASFLHRWHLGQQNFIEQWLRPLDGLPLLGLRLYLFPVFWDAGRQKLNWTSGDGLDRLTVNPATVEWFGNADWGLGLPWPQLLATLAAYTEFFGAGLLLLGFGVRWVSVPLLLTMIVAMLTVHAEHGWLAIASGGGFWASDRTIAAQERLVQAREILQQHGDYQWLTETGSFVVLNNGVEFAMTYALMLLVLLCFGAGRHVSLDHWLQRRLSRAG